MPEILVASLADLNNIRNDLAGTYRLAADIDARETAEWNDGAGWIPIGTYDAPFTGQLLGDGHTINGLFINRTAGEDDLGLFGALDGAIVADLKLANVSIESDYYNVGALVGTCCEDNPSVIRNCHSSGRVKGANCVGGLVGAAWGWELDGCTSSCAVISEGSAGGLIGETYESIAGSANKLRRCTATGPVTASGDYAGGLVGSAYYLECEECRADGRVLGDSYVGGFAGYLGVFAAERNMLTNCHATGYVIGNGSNVAGFVGYDDATQYDGCSAGGDVVGEDNVAGFVGYNGSAGAYNDCHATGNVTGNANGNCGGFVSYLSSTAQRCSATGRVMAAAGWTVGGFAAWISGTAQDCVARGKVSGESTVGGFAGGSDGTVARCYATGDVEGTAIEAADTGGLIGYNAGRVEDSYATGAVTAIDDTGGLVGYNAGMVLRCYSVGVVKAISNAGGLIGLNDEIDGIVIDSYYAIDTSGWNDTGKGEPRRTYELRRRNTFVRWDFTTIWSMVDEYTYPLLDASALQLAAVQQTAELIERLPGTYTHEPNSEVWKWLYLAAYEAVELRAVLADIKASRDIDLTSGATLDKHGENLRQPRGLASDANYRALLKARSARERSWGDLNTLLELLSTILVCEPSRIEITPGYELTPPEPAAVRIRVPAELIAPTGLSASNINLLLQRLVAGGVAVSMFAPGTFRFSSIPDQKESGKGTGFDHGTLGAYFDPAYETELPI